MFEREVGDLQRMEVDFALDENALLLIIFDRHKEGTFSALRLTAFNHEKTPFKNAFLRYEKGRVVQRQELPSIGEQLAVGEHSVTIDVVDGATIRATVDNEKSADIAFNVATMKPNLALGCGENNTTILRWKILGAAPDNSPIEWEEAFSILGTFNRSNVPVFTLSLFLWALLLGLPLLKVGFDTRTHPVDLATRALLLPMPRWIFAGLCLIPVTPMLLQWILGGMYVVYAWISCWEAFLDGHRSWEVRTDGGTSRWKWGASAVGLLLIGLLLLSGHSYSRSDVLNEPTPKTQGTRLAAKDGMQPIRLGTPLAANVSSAAAGPRRLRFTVELGENEVLRADLLRSLPTRGDVYQVDRSQDSPEERERAPDLDLNAEIEDPRGDYELRAVSAILSSDSGFPGQLRYLQADKYELSPYAGWVLEPGTHLIEMVVDAPWAYIAVDGTIRDFRTDLPPDFVSTAAQLLSMTPVVKGAGNLTVEAVERDTTAAVVIASQNSDLLGGLGLIALALGAFIGVFALSTRVRFTRGGLKRTLWLGTRAGVLIWLWVIWWMAERAGATDWSGERLMIGLGILAIIKATFDLAQTIRQSDEERPAWYRLVGGILLVAFTFVSFEGMARLLPERHHTWTHFWNYQLSPQWYWVHDPMIRRLNPWFIDQQFKRRDFSPEHEEKVRVMVFGGSQTYGWGIPSMDRMAFSDQLERALHRQGHREVEVLNAAFPGVKTATGLRWFAGNMLRYAPDIVVINFVVNEFMNVDQFHIWSGERGNQDTTGVTATSALIERWRGDAMGNHLSQIIVADVYEVYAMEQYLRWWKQIADEHGIKLVFSIEPTNLYVESGGKVIMREETQLGTAQDVYREVGAELGVPVYDVLPFFVSEQENLWFYDTMHMSRLGHRVFAENLGALIATEYL
jgi:lysophospholipase L1-like esterase